MTDSKPAKVRAALAKGPLSMQAIADATGVPLDDLRPVLWNMKRAGDIELSKTYSLTDKRSKVKA